MAGLVCCICGLAYVPHRYDHLWVCVGCLPNLAASLDHTARDILAVEEDTATRLLAEQAMEQPLTSRQVEAMARIARLWHQQADAG